MKTISELKKERENKHSELFEKCGVFFAFSNEQFNENKTMLEDGEKYVSIGAGGYLPKGKLNQFSEGMKAIGNWFKDEVKNQKLRKAHILYELQNHECFYTGDYSDALESLGNSYTKEEVLEVFKNNQNSFA